jgi:hypothetical protein
MRASATVRSPQDQADEEINHEFYESNESGEKTIAIDRR